MDRYDMATSTWQPSVLLPDKEEALSAAHADEDGLYLAYGSSIYRYDLDGSNETFILNQPTTIGRIFSNANVGIVIAKIPSSDGQATTFLKSNNSLVATTNLQRFDVESASDVTYVAGKKMLVLKRGTTYRRLEIDGDGIFGNILGLNLEGPGGGFGGGGRADSEKFFFYPSGLRFLDETGRVFLEGFPGTFTEVLKAGVTPRDVVFRGSRAAIVLNGNLLLGLRSNLQESGRKELPFQAERIFLFGDVVFTFGTDESGELIADQTTLAEIGDPQPDEPVELAGSRFEPDFVSVDRNGIVNILSNQYGTVFRWDPESQRSLPSINFVGRAIFHAFVSSQNRLYLGFNNGTVDYLNFSSLEPRQTNFLSDLERLEFLGDAGNNLLVKESFSTTRLYRANGTVAASGSTLFDSFGPNQTSVWDAPANRMFGTSVFGISSIVRSGSNLSGGTNSNTSPRVYFPLLITPNRSGILVESGAVLDLTTLVPLPGSLGNAINDATSLGGDVISIREILGLSQIQKWEGANLQPGTVKQLPGTPISIDRVDASSLIALTLGEDGVPSFYLLNNNLGVVAPDSLSAPGRVKAGAASSMAAEIFWLDVSGEEGYRIERREGSEGEFIEVGSVGTSVTSFVDPGLEAMGKTFEYRVIAVNGDLESAPSEVGAVEFVLPGEVAVLEATEITENSVTIAWSAVSGVTSYELQAFRINNPNNITTPDPQPGPGANSFVFSNLSLEDDYRFRVRGVNGLGAGAWATVDATTLPPLPSMPSNLRLQGSPTSTLIQLRWNISQSTNQSEYIIERRVESVGPFVEVGVTTNFLRFTDTGLDPSTSYEYRIKQRNSRGESAYSETFQASTGPLVEPTSPAGILTVNEIGGIKVSWIVNDPTTETIIIERQNDNNSEFVLIAEVDVNADGYLDSSVAIGFEYRYRIFAKNRIGSSNGSRTSQPVLMIDGVCLIDENFDSSLGSSNLEILGGELLSGTEAEGFPESGVLHFGGAFFREIRTVPLDLSLGGPLSFVARAGDQEEPGSALWDQPESGDMPIIEYRVPGETVTGFGSGNWQSLGWALGGNSSPNEQTSQWNSYQINLPGIESPSGVLLRVRQREFQGPGLDTWALDRLCVLGHRAPNIPPEISLEAPITLTANPIGDPIRLNFAGWVSDENPLDRFFYEIGEVSNPGIFSEFTIGMETGFFQLQFAPQATGSSTVEVVVSDSAGGVSTHEITVNAPTLQAPSIVREGLVELNPITGKYEQTLTIANNGQRGIAGIQVVVTSLNNGFVLDGHGGNIAVSNSPLGPGETVSLVLEYHSETSGVAPRPDFEVQILDPTGQPQAPQGGRPALRQLADSSKVFSFDSVVGQTYQIQYSDDMTTWVTSPVTVTAGANRAQWLDQGRPKTDCHPSECPSRYYRVVPVVTD